MNDLRTAAQQALEALEYMHKEKCDYMRRNNLGDPLREDAARLALPAIEALETALAQAEPVQEPFALPCPTPKACREHCCHGACLPAPQQAEPVAFDPAEAMRLADEYAYAQSELDGEHSVNRQYYVQSRNEERAKLASYLGIKEKA